MLIKNFWGYFYKQLINNIVSYRESINFYLFVLEVYNFYKGFNPESLKALEKTVDDLSSSVSVLFKLEKTPIMENRAKKYLIFIDSYNKVYKQ